MELKTRSAQLRVALYGALLAGTLQQTTPSGGLSHYN
jgi:hypothetical protein